MYYRRKVILSLLQQFGGSLTKLDFQKLLFLFTRKQSVSCFDFVPYKFGCFSWQAQQDLSTMIKYNQIEDANLNWKAIYKVNYINELSMKDRINLVQIYNKFKDIKGDSLIKYVYENYPYYAINSEIASRILDYSHYRIVEKQKPKINEYCLFSIGYEGKTVEQYTNQLINEDIKILIDIRKNPLSMKYGFSKNQLKNIIEGVGISYIHIPELGIDSDKRKELNSDEDYKKLFEEYESETLPIKDNEIKFVYNKFKISRRIALTCFEKDYKSCHRSRTINAIRMLFDKPYEIKHI